MGRLQKKMLQYMLALSFGLLLLSVNASARQQATNSGGPASEPATKHEPAAPSEAAASKPAPSVEDRLKALEQVIERQQREIQSLRDMVDEKVRSSTVAGSAPGPAPVTPTPVTSRPSEARGPEPAPAATAAGPAQGDEKAQTTTATRVDELYKKFGALRISGDIRFRDDLLVNQGFDSPVGPGPRNRLRIRARLAVEGTIDKNFDWGFRLNTSNFTDPISPNQTLTDFFTRKPFGLDRAFIRYDSRTDGPGVQLVAGKFEPTFRRTQMIWDDDVMVEGASEAIYFRTKSALSQFKLIAFQLPFSEQSGAKDGILYGGQAQGDFKISSSLSANFNVALYDWVRPGLVARGLGVAATQVNGGINNGAGLTGNQNGPLGTTNRLIRDASGNPVDFLAGFNLLDVLSQISWQATSRFPVTFTLDFVHNLTDRVDNEKNGFWGTVRVGRNSEQGDWLFEYTYTRIQQDAVLVPFNASDILASNSRAHIGSVGYQLRKNVSLVWNGLFSQRVNKVV
ncbi:MAG TPA: putative porin, partial [Blastocatellia bacterium]|nr:putative porin [Blastocatellia bacterium]